MFLNQILGTPRQSTFSLTPIFFYWCFWRSQKSLKDISEGMCYSYITVITLIITVITLIIVC